MEFENLKEGLIGLYDSTYKKRLNKATYLDEIKRIKDENYQLFNDLKEATVGEENESIEIIANIIPDHVIHFINQYPSKRKREVHQIDNNMNMVCFFVPLVNSVSKELAVRSVEVWNEKMPNSKIGLSSVEEINGGFKKGLCYITTAVCEILNKGDDCQELTILRDYRDQYLANTVGGEQVIDTYYNIAPTIVNRINKTEQSHEIYQQIWNFYIQPCITLIKEGKNEDCKVLYSEMVSSLEKRYM